MSGTAEHTGDSETVLGEASESWTSVAEAAAAGLHSLSDLSQISLLEVVCNNATVALFIMDERQHCVYMNRAAEQLTGFTLSEVRNKPLHNVIHHTRPDGRHYPLADCPIDRALPENNCEQGEEIFVRPDGRFYPVFFTASPIRDRSGRPIGTVIEVQDISERQQREQALHEARLRLDAAVSAAEVGLFVWDIVADRVYGDRNVDDIFGIELDPDGTAPLARFAAVIHPEDRNRVLNRIQLSVDTGCDYEAEYRIISRGRERWVIGRGKIEKDAQGRSIRFPGILLEITERKKIEAARREIEARYSQQSRLLEGIASATPDFIYVFNREGRVLYANRRLLQVWDRRPEDAIGKTFTELGYAGWHGEKHLRDIAQVLSTRKPVSGEFTFTGATGISGVYEYIFSPVLNPSGEVEVIAATTREITQRKQTEESVRLGKEILEVALAASDTGIFRFDMRRREFLVCDLHLKRLLGLTPESEIRTPEDFLCRVHPEDLPAVRAGFEQTLLEGVDFEMEFRVVHPDGSVHWLLDRAKVRRSGEGPDYLVGACTDITRRRESEAAARAAGERFRFLAETIPQKIFTARPDGTADYFNQQWNDFTALPLEELQGWGWTKCVHPDDLEDNVRRWQHAVATGEPYQVEHRFRRHDGVYRWHLTRARAMRDERGQVTIWLGSNTDIDDVKRSEQALRETAERLKAAMDASHTGTYRWDVRTNDINWDENLLRLLHLPREHRVDTLDRLLTVIHPDDRAGFTARVEQVRAEGKDFDMEFRIMLPDGSVRWLDDKGKTFHDDQGRPLYMTGACVDITERKRADEERQALLEAERQARADAETASRLKDEFLATLSHELRTPLTAILGWSQLLLRHHQSGEVGDGLAVIERNARVQVQLVEDLLDMSRIVSGKLRLDVQRVDIAAVIRAAVDSVMPAATAKEIRVHTLLDTHVTPVRGDAARLQQVVWNLLSNAIKFTPRGGRVQVALERVNSHIEVTVTDTGAGIAPEFLPFVFERFRQADGASNRKHGGLGIGLAIVKSLVEMHGGTVRAKSAGIGHGASFSVELPLLALHEGDSSGERHHPRLSDWDELSDFPGERMLEGVSILVVDDEKDARELIRRVLEDCAGTVTVAADAMEAFGLMQTVRPDVLLSDIGMPGEDGYGLIRRVRALSAAEGGDTPAVALTAFARSEDRRRALLAGFQAHVVKPVEPAELVTVVASVAGKMGRRRS